MRNAEERKWPDDLARFLRVLADSLDRGRLIGVTAQINGAVKVATEYPDEVSALEALTQMQAFLGMMDNHRRASG